MLVVALCAKKRNVIFVSLVCHNFSQLSTTSSFAQAPDATNGFVIRLRFRSDSGCVSAVWRLDGRSKRPRDRLKLKHFCLLSAIDCSEKHEQLVHHFFVGAEKTNCSHFRAKRVKSLASRPPIQPSPHDEYRLERSEGAVPPFLCGACDFVVLF
jgi:hypothetical protein